jgi:hypothetical protein
MSKGRGRCYACLMPTPPPEGPPAGGYGGRATSAGERQPAEFGPAPSPPDAKSDAGRALAVTVGIVGSAIVTLSTLGVLGVLGVRKYLSGAKSSEVKNCLGQIAKDAAVAHERDGRLCASASRPVPADVSLLRGRKYQSQSADWDVDKPPNAGFACLDFSLNAPQYYQYRYEATATSFLAGGRGDLDGDGDLSNFTITGEVRDGRLMLSPSIEESDPEE